MTASGAAPVASAHPSGTARIDREGRWISHAPLSIGVIGVYIFLMLVLFFLGRATEPTLIPDPIFVAVAALAIFLARYASTTYTMDADQFLAGRLFGSRSVPLADVRRIELANLRDLGPVSFWGGWGWRGRTWSAIVGTFDSVHTVSPGVLVFQGPVPLFVSPKDPVEFATELSRRVRSYNGSVEIGPGIPGSNAPASRARA
jgi:hypothetical protein